MTTSKTRTAPVDAGAIFDHAIEMYENSLKASVQAQEDACKMMIDAMDGMFKPPDFTADPQWMLNDLLPTAQKQLDELMKQATGNAELCAQLMNKAMEAGQSRNAADAQARTRELFEAWLAAFQAQVQAMLTAQSNIFRSWGELSRQHPGTTA